LTLSISGGSQPSRDCQHCRSWQASSSSARLIGRINPVLGWAAFPWLSEHPEIVNYEKVLNFADRALGEAKRTGKNRAVGLLPAGDQLVPTVSEMVYPGYIAADVLPIVGTTGHQQE
jgi:hypothetical protein